MTQDWPPSEILWLNPPWTLWPRIVDKLQKSNCEAICICPDWKKQWVKKLLDMASEKINYSPGAKIFELHGSPMEGIKWGLWALLIPKRGDAIADRQHVPSTPESNKTAPIDERDKLPQGATLGNTVVFSDPELEVPVRQKRGVKFKTPSNDISRVQNEKLHAPEALFSEVDAEKNIPYEIPVGSENVTEFCAQNIERAMHTDFSALPFANVNETPEQIEEGYSEICQKYPENASTFKHPPVEIPDRLNIKCKNLSLNKYRYIKKTKFGIFYYG